MPLATQSQNAAEDFAVSDMTQQFREMMERFEYTGPAPAEPTPTATDVVRGFAKKWAEMQHQRGPEAVFDCFDFGTLTDAERFYRLHGCSPRTYIDRAEGLVPLKQKPEPVREVPEISGDVYAAIVRFA